MSAPYPLDPEAAPLDPAIARFHQDLAERVGLLAGRRPGAPGAGRLNLAPDQFYGGDRGVQTGPDGDKARIEALRHSRVLVPLYSEQYFRNLRCGREWQIFVRCRGAGAGGGPIVPVLWRPVPSVLLPQAARRVDFDHRRIGTGYAADGLLALARSARRQDEYREAVGQLAACVVDQGSSCDLPSGAAGPESEEGADLDTARSAFDDPGLVRLLVAALPDSPTARTWSLLPPQGDGEPPESLARQVSRMLEVQGYSSVTERLDRTGPLPPPHPGAVTVLLIDPWTLDDDRYRERVRMFIDRELARPLAVLVPWSATGQGAEERLMRVHAALEPWLNRNKPELRRLPIVVTDPGDFRPTVAQELHRAAELLAAQATGAQLETAQPVPEPEQERPRLVRRDSGPLGPW